MTAAVTPEDLREEAWKFLKTSNPDPVKVTQARELARTLKNHTEFGLARRLLDKICKHLPPDLPAAEREKLAQQHALCTYRDEDLPVRQRLQRALEILTKDASLTTSTRPETLGQAGAIHKRLWEAFGQRDDLERSLGYYQRGHAASRLGQETDDTGWNAINEAYVLDLLENLEQSQAWQPPVSAEPGASAGVTATRPTRHEQAQAIRREIVDSLTRDPVTPALSAAKKEWWFFATLAEAHFGLGDYPAATQCIADGLDAYRRHYRQEVPTWELETTARQLLSLARLQAAPGGGATHFRLSPEIRDVLQPLLGANDEAVRQLLIGKVGLALSGGGFRAALFHIGVLARLADLDLLRAVDVISCVSGGSIVGAYYYLKLRELLESKPDHPSTEVAGDPTAISHADYIQLVRELSQDFLKSVQTNIRMRLFTPRNALDLALHPQRTSTEQLAELYESEFYQPLLAKRRVPSLQLRDLYVVPYGCDRPKGDARPEFNPKNQNWHRAAKVPMLVLNATTLNTGHVWQFTTSYLGESPSRIESDVDANARLRRVYYRDAPEHVKNVSLGTAVAASSCVPFIFEPIVFQDLHKQHTVRLVDGGVFDNQGVDSLLEQNCSVLLVSDASGQVQTAENPAGDRYGVLSRVNNISMERVRIVQYQEALARQESGAIRGLMFLHLRMGVKDGQVSWKGCTTPSDEELSEQQAATGSETWTNYDMPNEVQRRLAALRTDLDSFSDIEAYALMLSGYRMTKSYFDNQTWVSFEHLVPEGARASVPEGDWPFLKLDPLLQGKPGESEFDRLLAVLGRGRYLVLRGWPVRGNPPSWLVVAGLLLWLAVVICFWAKGWYWSSTLALLIPVLVHCGILARRWLARLILSAAAIPFAWYACSWGRKKYLDKGSVPAGPSPPNS